MLSKVYIRTVIINQSYDIITTSPIFCLSHRHSRPAVVVDVKTQPKVEHGVRVLTGKQRGFSLYLLLFRAEKSMAAAGNQFWFSIKEHLCYNVVVAKARIALRCHCQTM